MKEIPVVYYDTNNAWFTSPNFSDLFFKHFVPEVKHYQENVLRIAPEEVKALLLLDNAPAHPDAEKLVSADGKLCIIFLPPNTTSITQPMDLGIMVSCKRLYRQKCLDEGLVVIEEEEDLEEDTRGQRPLMNIDTNDIKSDIYNFVSGWKD